MRNCGLPLGGRVFAAFRLALVLAVVPGCVPPDAAAPGGVATPAAAGSAKPALAPVKSKDVSAVLAEGYAALGRKDLDAAGAAADRVIAAGSGATNGSGVAEAQYLRGRTFEERAARAASATDIAGARQNLQFARDAYNAGLTVKAAPELEGRLHAGIANVAYFQEDYSTAIAAWTKAFDKLTEPQTKSWVLYRIGLSQQRFGQFDEADKTFATVQQQFANSEPARRAAAHQGARGFHIQIGVYSTPANADSALVALRADGVIGMRLTDNQGRNVVRVGPMRTYAEAKTVRARLAAKYPDAMIIP